MLARLSLSAALLLLCARLLYADQPAAPALRGVLAVRPFSLATGIEFRAATRTQVAQRGYVLSIEVEEAPFAAQGAPGRQIFIDQTAAVWVAGPLGPSAHPYVLVLVPEVDLSRARLWLGSRVPVAEQSAASIASQLAAARSRGETIRIEREPQGAIVHSWAEATALAREPLPGTAGPVRSRN